MIDREAATRLGVSMSTISTVLNNSFSQRQVSVMYGPLNQYHVVMGVDPRFAQDIESLKQVEVITATGVRVPMSAFARFEDANAPLSVQHQGLFVADTVSFSLAPGVSLGQATAAIDAAVARIGLPSDQIQAGFQGTAAALQQTLAQQPWLILAALVTMYIVLGILYESFVHPLTILSTLPSAGLGALLALLMLRQDFTLIALIGVFLLIGIVKKNAIMMVDFALEAERTQAGAARRDLPGLPDALPSHHDDDHGRHLRRAAADAGHRRRRRDAPAAGHHHRGRPGVEPDPDALHHARGLSLSGPLPSLGRAQAPFRRRGGRFFRTSMTRNAKPSFSSCRCAAPSRSRCAPCWAPAPSARLSAPGAGHRRILQGRAGRGAGLETRRTA